MNQASKEPSPACAGGTWRFLAHGDTVARIRPVKTIGLEELKAKIDREDRFPLIEALPPYEYERGHLPGAIDIPPNQIAELSASILPDKSAEIVVYCVNPQCHASENAAEELERLGYTRVRVFPEGKQGWFDAGLKLEHSTGAEAPATIDHE
jgi:rhodanese-related sulfurtransferase